MQTIFLCSSRRGTCRVHLGALASALLAVVLLAGLAASYYLGSRTRAVVHDVRPEVYAAALRAQIEAERERVETAARAARDDLDALAGRLGKLQARLMRLEALGTRMVERAALDPGEFDFAQPPPSGGPASAGEALSVGDFLAELEALGRTLEDRDAKLRALELSLMGRQLDSEMRPAGRPVRSGWLSSRFGRRIDPLDGRRGFHSGLDFAGRAGSEVVAVAAGLVIRAGKRPGYGYVIDIDHGDGLVTRYAHNRKNLVRAGDVVRKGQTIALMGSSGRTTGTHVHLEVLQDGRPIDPMEFVRAAR